MAESKRKGKKWKKDEHEDKPTKEEKSIAKYLRFKCPTKDGKLCGMEVKYFIASKAIDCLMESKFIKQLEAPFTTRSTCSDYLGRLMRKGMFHRAIKAERKKDKKKEEEERKKRAKKEGKDVEEENCELKKDEKKKDQKKDKEDEKKKKKERRTKLEMPDEQFFQDGDGFYVWIFDPTPISTFVIGLLMVLGAIGLCLFPLWPPEVRLGIYYLSVAAAAFVGVIIFLCVLRFILFCCVWLFTMGKHHFWLLPNLTEDVGFFESFVPLYKHDLMDESRKDGKKKPRELEQEKSPKAEKGVSGAVPAVEEGRDSESEEKSGSENDNGYEFVEKRELEETEESKCESKKTK